MNFQSFLHRVSAVGLAAACLFAVAAEAQQRPRPVPMATPALIINNGPRNLRVAERNNVYSAGYVQTSPVNTGSEIVGAYNEQEQSVYSENNAVVVNAGANKGVHVGELMSVTRPRGTVKTRRTRKNDLGFYVEELGVLEVTTVKPEVSIARVRTSCADMQLGDLVQPFQPRVAPLAVSRPALDLFGDPSGKATGRLFMARDHQEMLTREQIVYVDLGAEDSVQVGDYLTIYRTLGKGNPFENDEDYNTDGRIYGYQSDEYRGGKFSNRAARKSGDKAQGRTITLEDPKKNRPAGLRKVVGEAVILNVKERTATAIITASPRKFTRATGSKFNRGTIARNTTVRECALCGKGHIL